jgi:hypothetical protein
MRDYNVFMDHPGPERCFLGGVCSGLGNALKEYGYHFGCVGAFAYDLV